MESFAPPWQQTRLNNSFNLYQECEILSQYEMS